MKKKFFTLLAAAAVCGLGAANAQTGIDAGAVHTSKLIQGSLYHVGADASNYIYAVKVADNEVLKWGKVDTLANGVWCVKAKTPESSTYPEFTFENKAKGEFLGVDLTPYFATGVKTFKATLGYSDRSASCRSPRHRA